MTENNNYLTEQTFRKFLEEEKRHHERDERAGAERGEQIKKILEKQASMQTSLDSISKWRVRTDRLLEKHSHFLYGNGEPGIDEVLRNINKWINEQKEERAKTKQLDKEITIMGIKTTAEIKIAIISGFFILLNGIVTWWLTK